MTTTRRKSICLTAEDERELKLLASHFGENESQVIRRAIMLLYFVMLVEQKKPE